VENPNTFALIHVALVLGLFAVSFAGLHFYKARARRQWHDSRARVDAILTDIRQDRRRKHI